MALVKRFEELDAWKQARVLAREIYTATKGAQFRRDLGLVDQIRRAAVSSMNNVAEGFDSGSRIEFRRFLRYAVRSASEVQRCLYVALDQEYMSQIDFDTLYAQSTSARRLCLGLLRHLSTSKDAPLPSRSGEPAHPRTPALPNPRTRKS